MTDNKLSSFPLQESNPYINKGTELKLEFSLIKINIKQSSQIIPSSWL